MAKNISLSATELASNGLFAVRFAHAPLLTKVVFNVNTSLDTVNMILFETETFEVSKAFEGLKDKKIVFAIDFFDKSGNVVYTETRELRLVELNKNLDHNATVPLEIYLTFSNQRNSLFNYYDEQEKTEPVFLAEVQ